MPKLILSICGPSAVGKATLLKGFLDPVHGPKLRSDFQLPVGNLITVGLSPRDCQRLLLPQFLDDDVVLHKWQLSHATDERQRVTDEIDLFHFACPGVEHRVVFLWLPWEQWWHGHRAKEPHLTNATLKGDVVWIYNTVLAKLQTNRWGIELEHFGWYYPKAGGPPIYQRLAKAPEHPASFNDRPE
jgi:hypothetical protein